MANSSSVELRGPIPREVANVLDAMSITKNMTRHDLIVRILTAYARDRVHEATVIQNVMQGNPLPPDNGWKDTV